MLSKLLSPKTQKDLNLKTLFYYIANESGLTRMELAERMGLSPSTCMRFIDELKKNDLIYECGEAESSGGRRAKRYAVSPTSSYLIGVDISRTSVRILLLQLDLEPVDATSFRMTEGNTPDVTITKIADEIKQILAKHNIDMDLLLGVGISSIGPLDTNKGMIKNPKYFPAKGWKEVPIVEQLQQLISVPTILCYGEQTALYAEHRFGAALNSQNAVHINKGIGIRLGLLLNGKIVRPNKPVGAFGQGHMTVDIDGRRCDCGNYGCMNAYSTIPAILKEVRKHLKKGAESTLHSKISDVTELRYSHLVEAYNEGDILVADVLKDTALYSGAGLANLVTIFQPDIVILSGPIYQDFDIFFTTSVKQAKKRYERYFPSLETQFCKGDLGDQARAIGSGGLMFETMFTN